MATIIDSLLIQLGFETSGMTKGQKNAGQALSKVNQSVKTSGDGLVALGKTGADSFRSLAREAVAFFAVLTAGKSLKAFVQDNTEANVALGNLARNLGTTTETLGAWQNVARSFGGTASDVSGSMQSLVSQFQTLDGRTNLARTFGYMHVQLMNSNGQLRSMTGLIPDLAAAAQRLGPQLFSALGQQAGFSQGFINMLEQNPQQLLALYKQLQQYAPTQQDAQASQDLLQRWVLLQAQSASFGRTLLTDVTPALDQLMDTISNLIGSNQSWIISDIDQFLKNLNSGAYSKDLKNIKDDVQGFIDAIRSINWKQVNSDIQTFVADANGAATALGGWQKVAEDLFALWLGSKFIKVLANITALRAALGLGSMGTAGAGILASPLGAAAVGTGIAVAGAAALQGADVNGAKKAGLNDADTASAIAAQADGGIAPDYSNTPAAQDDGWGPLSKYLYNLPYKLLRSLPKTPDTAPATPYQPNDILKSLNITPQQFDAYRSAVSGIETGGQKGGGYGVMGGAGGSYAGRYQMSHDAIKEAAAYLHESTPSMKEFLSNPGMQDRYFEAYTALNAQYLSSHNQAFNAMPGAGKLDVLGYAWNQGAGGANKWLNTGVSGSDAFGTSGTKYASAVEDAQNKIPGLPGAPSPSDMVANAKKINDALTASVKQAMQSSYLNSSASSQSVEINAPITVNDHSGDPKKTAALVKSSLSEVIARQSNIGLV